MPRLLRLSPACLVLAAACGGSGGGSDSPTTPTTPTTPTPPTTSTSNAIAVRDNSFDPTTTTVAAGTTVTWTWNGNNRHNVSFDGGPASATQTSGTFSRTFASAGTFSYVCTVHGTGMSGTVTVR